MSLPPGTDDLTGRVFGRLTVTGYAGSSPKGSMWACTCACGGIASVRRDRLLRGGTRSCGCAKKTSRAVMVEGVTSEKHPLYNTWTMMRYRCKNPKTARYRDYGGRGITVDPRWDSFEQFVADMGPKPSPAHTLDRKDNDGPYSPQNCRWATNVEQQVTRRGRNPPVFIEGEQMTFTQACEKLGVDRKQAKDLQYMNAQQVVDFLLTCRKRVSG